MFDASVASAYHTIFSVTLDRLLAYIVVALTERHNLFDEEFLHYLVNESVKAIKVCLGCDSCVTSEGRRRLSA